MLDPRLEELRSVLFAIAPLPFEQFEAFARHVSFQTLAPGESLVRFGGPPARMAFVLKGLLKAYYLTRKGDEFIRTFCAEKSFAAAYAALVARLPKAEVDLVAIEASELLVFDWENFAGRFQDHWTWQQIGRVIAEITYYARERRQFEFMTMSAEERFDMFMAAHGDLAARISQKDMASYLGVTPVSLSRLRARKRARKQSKDNG